MKIFIRNLPSSTTQRELRIFAEQLLSPKWYTPFAVKGKILNCEVRKVKDQESGEIQYYGLMEIKPFKAAQMAIKKLNGQTLKGRRIEARKWHDRSYQADRRDRYRRNTWDPSKERRSNERRRSQLEVEVKSNVRVEAVKGFNRQYDD